MKLPNILPYARYIIIGLSVFFAVCMLRACYIGGKISEKVAENPPIPRKEVKAIVEAAKTAEKAAVFYKAKAKKLQHKADSTQQLATRHKDQADSIRTLHDEIPASATEPLGLIERELSVYETLDTTSL